jgi:hypothetical protein
MNIINSSETMFHVMLLVTLPPFLTQKCCVCEHIHTHALQLLNQLAGLHEALYKCYAITAHTTSYVLVFL